MTLFQTWLSCCQLITDIYFFGLIKLQNRVRLTGLTPGTCNINFSMVLITRDSLIITTHKINKTMKWVESQLITKTEHATNKDSFTKTLGVNSFIPIWLTESYWVVRHNTVNMLRKNVSSSTEKESFTGVEITVFHTDLIRKDMFLLIFKLKQCIQSQEFL